MELLLHNSERVTLGQPGTLVSVIQELYDAADRSAAIVGCALVESSLEEALKTVLHNDSVITNSLFGPDGACGAFSAKIDLGKLVGLYGAKAHTDLHTVRKIRNQFTHALGISDFKAQSVSNLASKLRLCESYTIDAARQIDRNGASRPCGGGTWFFTVKDRSKALENPRQRYLITVQALTIGLSEICETQMPRPGF